jgi:hypothetical protein
VAKAESGRRISGRGVSDEEERECVLELMLLFYSFDTDSSLLALT